MFIKTFGIRGCVFLLALSALAGGAAAQGQKMTPEEIIAKHVASIGKSDVITAAKNRIAIGASEFEMRMAAKKAKGRAMMASDGNNVALFSTFNMTDYKMERIGYFAEKIDIPFIVPGRRSPLGGFLSTYDKFLDNHIFGGAVFTSWVFLRPDSTWGKFEVEGKKKVGDRDAWVVNYTPTGGGLKGGSYIKLYFDTENFRHLRTVYRQKETDSAFAGSNGGMQPGGVGGTIFSTNTSGAWSNDMANNGMTLTEDFEDIRADNGLTLPHKYSILLAVDGGSGSSQFKWDFVIEEYRPMKEFPAETFRWAPST